MTVTKYLISSHLTTEGKIDEPSWKRLLSDFDALASGAVDGVEVARGGRRLWRFVLLIVKGDEDMRSNELGLPHHNTPSGPCADCLCNDTDMPLFKE